MPASGYSLWSVVAGEQPTTAKWNILGSNDASFNTGVGFNDAILQTRHFASGSVLSTALALGTSATGGIQTASAGSGLGAYSYSYVNVGGLKFLWGVLQAEGTTGGYGVQVNFPSGFFTSAPVVVGTVGANNTTNNQTVNLGGGSNPTTTSVVINTQSGSNTSQEPVQFLCIGT